MKIFAFFGLSGILFFLIILIVSVIQIFIYSHLLISFEFESLMRPYALAGAIYVGISFSVGQFSLLTQSFQASKKKFISKLKSNIGLFIATLFIAIFLSLMSYEFLISIPANYLHNKASKTNIEIKVIANSAWPHRYKIESCPYGLVFDVPKISHSVQSVCLGYSQWPYFRDVDYPIEVTLFGNKSFFGYELNCCQ